MPSAPSASNRSSVFDALPEDHQQRIYTSQAYRWFLDASKKTGLPLCPDWSPTPNYGRGFAHFVRDLGIPWSEVAITRYRFNVAEGATELNPTTVSSTVRGARRLVPRRTSSHVRLQHSCVDLLRSLRDSGTGDQVAELLLLFSYAAMRSREERPEPYRDGRHPLIELRVEEGNFYPYLQAALRILNVHTPGPKHVNPFAMLRPCGLHASRLVENYQPAHVQLESNTLSGYPLSLDVTPHGHQHPHVMADGEVRRQIKNAIAQAIHAAEYEQKTELTQTLRDLFQNIQLDAQSWIRTAASQLEWLRRHRLYLQGVDAEKELRRTPKMLTLGDLPPFNPPGAEDHERHSLDMKRYHQRRKTHELEKQREEAAAERRIKKAKKQQGLPPAFFRQFCLLGHVADAAGPSVYPSVYLHHDVKTVRQALQKTYATRTYLPKDNLQQQKHNPDAAAAACTEALLNAQASDYLHTFLADDVEDITPSRADHPWSAAATERRRLYNAWRRQQQQQLPINQRHSAVIWPPPLQICSHNTHTLGQILLPRPPVLPLAPFRWTFARGDVEATPPINVLTTFGHLMELWLRVDGPWAAAQVNPQVFKRIEVYMSITADGSLSLNT